MAAYRIENLNYDMARAGDTYVLHLPLAGFANGQVYFEVRGAKLRLWIEGCAEIDEDLCYGGMEAAFDLDGEIRSDGIEAVFRDGHLWVTVPVTPARRRRIDLRALPVGTGRGERSVSFAGA